jgi:hypothetical protein
MDDELRLRLGRQAQEHASTWTWDAAVEAMEEVLTRAATGHAERA